MPASIGKGKPGPFPGGGGAPSLAKPASIENEYTNKNRKYLFFKKAFILFHLF